ncbi:RDD family protein [Halorubrum sp. Atlit-26R]|uniref:RDD family protein n=1 Tax=Halorubrum sp. Atlit-26R TaxID=2282128 RepID=UPI000EF1A1B9|nr:RDD family protein [Halorubrum sp. Atlit-26R]RLM63303.1 RDD family protein [Halorubrum sp. Atlit-26R]
MEKHPQPQRGTNGDVVWHRVGAFLIDSILMGLIWGPVVLVGAALGDIGFLVLASVGLAATLVYGFLLEGLYGYTPGKYLLGLVVIKSDGSNCSIGASILRNLLWVVDALPTFNLIAIGSILLTDDNQRVGDLVADTVVVKQQEGP